MFFPPKKILTYCMILLLLGCSKSLGIKKVHPHLGISLSMPSNWKEIKLDTLQEMRTLAFEDGLSGLIMLKRVEAVNTEQWLNEIIYANQPIRKHSSLFSSRYKIYWVYYEKNMLSHIVYIIKDNRGYVYSITCTCLKENFKKNRKIFDQVARSFDEI